MAARSRPRAGQAKDDADEERSLWNQVRENARKGDSLMAESNAISRRIANLAEKQSAAEERGDIPSSRTDLEITDLLRQNISIIEKLQSLVGGDDSDPSDDLPILNSLSILAALRGANELDAPPMKVSTSSSGKAGRDRIKRAKHEHSASDDRDSLAADSPGGPSPKVIITHKGDRFKGGSSRAGSVPVVREPSVKTEDIDERESLKATTPSTPTLSSGSLDAPRPKLHRGTEVFYRNKAKAVEGEGILCSVTAVIGDGKQRRYEIIDADPEPPTPPQPYRASVNHLVPIQPDNKGLGKLGAGAAVLALYPQTTTFYKAEVVSMEGEVVTLKFEGEEEKDREMAVERRYVLPDTGK
ncbi:hypothetical protein EJ05DRAFT_538780 [Pseudovirgaria hyperparasitica]|uniref:SGF29 C-terminal domain-containing protein n=1 Tax=Pseudovirgaria hyperparasitica TaxID=470096 RepID=A0A6A6W3V4_9PEZI|nr:uncharacterized protein EJ05DRAFT_538780 [Pseudovirgaria hyperparasitica]KAF2757618.1 hypothetical protein EJ05DRAFT_538780 [Pseudovirgaria hyperparasitica]